MCVDRTSTYGIQFRQTLVDHEMGWLVVIVHHAQRHFSQFLLFFASAPFNCGMSYNRMSISSGVPSACNRLSPLVIAMARSLSLSFVSARNFSNVSARVFAERNTAPRYARNCQLVTMIERATLIQPNKMFAPGTAW